ncbi:hypothetical protein R50073_07920 [Maricurvus nonylphenolicus]
MALRLYPSKSEVHCFDGLSEGRGFAGKKAGMGSDPQGQTPSVLRQHVGGYAVLRIFEYVNFTQIAGFGQ